MNPLSFCIAGNDGYASTPLMSSSAYNTPGQQYTNSKYQYMHTHVCAPHSPSCLPPHHHPLSPLTCCKCHMSCLPHLPSANFRTCTHTPLNMPHPRLVLLQVGGRGPGKNLVIPPCPQRTLAAVCAVSRSATHPMPQQTARPCMRLTPLGTNTSP